MDALDEFFRVWCAPDAWCDRCKEYPAIHIAVQGKEALCGSFVTYVRVWDPSTQTHIALCRTCNQQHTAALGNQGFQSTPQVYQPAAISPRQGGHQAMRHQRLRHLPRRVWRVLTRLLFPWRAQKSSQTCVDTKSYSRIGT